MTFRGRSVHNLDLEVVYMSIKDSYKGELPVSHNLWVLRAGAIVN